jgi:hypothetical protein
MKIRGQYCTWTLDGLCSCMDMDAPRVDILLCGDSAVRGSTEDHPNLVVAWLCTWP